MEIEICGVKYTEADVPLNAAKEALLAQGACNLSGVLISLGERAKQLCDHPRNSGTAWKNHHPVMVLFLAQYAHLCTGDIIGMTSYHHANQLCEHVVNTVQEDAHVAI